MYKNFIIIMILALSGTLAKAQNSCWGETESDSIFCAEAYGLWQLERQSNKNLKDPAQFEAVYNSWLTVRKKCPDCLHQKVFTEGDKYYGSLIKQNQADSVLMHQYVDSLLGLYMIRKENFPEKGAFLDGKYGSQLFKYRPDEYETAQPYLKSSLDAMKDKSSPTNVQAYYYTIYQQYAASREAKDSLLKVQKKVELLREYVVLDDYMNTAVSNLEGKVLKLEAQDFSGDEKKMKKKEKDLARLNKQKNSYETVKDNLVKIFLKIESDCESLCNLLADNLVDSTNVETYRTAVSILSIKQCIDAPCIVEWLPKSDDGTHKAAFTIGLIMLKNERADEALTWFEKAIERCGDCPEKLDYLIRAGQTASIAGSISKSKQLARQILEIDSKNAQAYMILGDAWASSGCNDGKFGKACAFWVATDYYARAKSLDPSLADKANSNMGRIRSGFPSRTDVFTQGMQVGDSYTCCGVSTTIRTRD